MTMLKHTGFATRTGCLAAMLAVAFGYATRAYAEDQRPEYQTIRYNEDWSVMRDPTKRTDPFDALKWIPLNGDGSWYMTIGGELRARYEISRHPVFGLDDPPHNDYLLLRSFLFADVHFGPYVRTFVELVSGLAPGWKGDPPPTEKDQLDLLQAFGEVTVPLGNDKLVVRGGRQEMTFGSSRLVGLRDSPNVQRTFDGLRLSFIQKNGLRLDAFVVRPVAVEAGTFNDRSDTAQAFWGLYATTPVPGIPDLKADLYYFGLNRRDAVFAQGIGNEHRQTIGTRLFGARNHFDWNIEAAFQFGSFGTSDIRAWTVSSNVGYTFIDLPFSPRLGLNADAISGDHNLNNRTLGTFNPLFPKLPYFSEANIVAPANLLDIQPNLTLALTPKVSLNIGWNPLWKEAKADAFYAPPLTPMAGTAGGAGRYIGQQVSTTVNWTVDEHLNVGGTYVHYTPGRRIREVGGRSGDFAAAWVQWLF